MARPSNVPVKLVTPRHHRIPPNQAASSPFTNPLIGYFSSSQSSSTTGPQSPHSLYDWQACQKMNDHAWAARRLKCPANVRAAGWRCCCHADHLRTTLLTRRPPPGFISDSPPDTPSTIKVPPYWNMLVSYYFVEQKVLTACKFERLLGTWPGVFQSTIRLILGQVKTFTPSLVRP